MVTVSGALGLPETGYYSAEIYQQADSVKAADDCVRQPAFPDYSKAKPDRNVRSYQVKMWFHNTPPEGPVHATIVSGQRQMQPWNVYASYFLTGEFVFLRLLCRRVLDEATSCNARGQALDH